MATFSLDNAEVVRATLQTMGLGRTAANMDTATEADVRAVIRSGLRRFYFPTVGEFVYQWRFLEKHFSISVVATYSTGTVAVSGGVVTLVGGTWPTGMGDYFISVDGHVLFTTADQTGLTVPVSNTQLSVTAGATYTAYKYRYPLPSDFSEWLGGVVYSNGESDSSSRMLAGSSEAEIRLRYAIGQGTTNSRTTHYAVTNTPDATTESRMLLWPVPEPDAFIQGVYLSAPDDNLPADLTVPGVTVQVLPMYAEAVLEAILSAAEEYNNDTGGTHSQRFQVALQTAITHDKAKGGSYDFSNRTGDDRLGHGQVLSSIDFTNAM